MLNSFGLVTETGKKQFHSSAFLANSLYITKLEEKELSLVKIFCYLVLTDLLLRPQRKLSL